MTGASNLCHCQLRQLDEPAKDSFFRGGLTPCIHDALTKLPLHGEVVYPELQTDLEKAIQYNGAAMFGKIRQGMPADTFSRAIPTVHGNGQLVTGSAAGVLKEEHITGTSFGVVEETLEEEGGVVSGITAPSQVSGGQEMEDSDVIMGSTPGCNRSVLVEIPMPQCAKGFRPVQIAPRNIFETPLTEQAQAVDSIQTIMDDEDCHRTSATVTQAAAAALAPSLAVTATDKELLARRLRLMAKELKHFQEMIATEVGIGHLLRMAAQEGIEMPASPNIPQPSGLQSVPAAIQPKCPIDGLVLMVVNTSLDTGVNDDGKVNKECLEYVLGDFPLKPITCNGLWLKEPQIQSQTRMAAYTSDSPKVSALQCGFCRAWLQVLGLKKDMSLVSDDMGQVIELDNRFILPPYTWPSDKAFPDDANYGYPTHDLSFVVEGQWAEFPYLQRIEDLPYPRRYKCTAGSSDVKPKFGMYFGMPSHEEYGLPVMTMGIIQMVSALSMPRRSRIQRVPSIGQPQRHVHGVIMFSPMENLQ